MKTTIEISDALLAEAKAVASRDGTTLRALVEDGLARAIEQRAAAKPYVYRDASVGGNGFTPEAAAMTMDEIITMSYGDRGGTPE